MGIETAIRAVQLATTLLVTRKIAVPSLASITGPTAIFLDHLTSQKRAVENNSSLAPFNSNQEQDALRVNVNWVHTKFMLIDPLGSKPATQTGSANFSEASVNTNYENMVLIRSDTRVADIYFGEFMRVFAHHRFRESVKRHIEEFGSAAFNTWKRQDLFEDWKKWVLGQYKSGSEHEIKRLYFVG